MTSSRHEAALEEALRRLASLGRSQAIALQASFRSAVAQQSLDAAQSRALNNISPYYIIRRCRSARSASEYLQIVRHTATALAMLETPDDLVLAALSDFVEAAAAEQSALHLLMVTAQLEIVKACHAADQSESALLETVRRACFTGATLGASAQAVREALVAYFGAVGGELEPSASASQSGWTVPLGPLHLRLTFNDKRRRPGRREQKLLARIAAECGPPASRFAAAATELPELVRARIARELHDGPAQTLALLRLQFEMHQPPASEFTEVADTAITGVRGLMDELSAQPLHRIGLLPAIRKLLDHLETTHGIRTRLHTRNLPTLSLSLQTAIYRVVQECLSNVARHSAANFVEISLGYTGTVLSVCLEDNGRGFDVTEAASRRRAYGVAAVRAQVEVLGGSLTVQSTAHQNTPPGKRKPVTRVVIQLPTF